MSKQWGLQGFLGLNKMGERKFSLEFESREEAQRVRKGGKRSFPSFQVEVCSWMLEENSKMDKIIKEL